MHARCPTNCEHWGAGGPPPGTTGSVRSHLGCRTSWEAAPRRGSSRSSQRCQNAGAARQGRVHTRQHFLLARCTCRDPFSSQPPPPPLSSLKNFNVIKGLLGSELTLANKPLPLSAPEGEVGLHQEKRSGFSLGGLPRERVLVTLVPPA